MLALVRNPVWNPERECGRAQRGIVRSMMPKLLHSSCQQSSESRVLGEDITGLTWIARMAISAHIIARDFLNQFLEGLLIPHLLALT